MHRTLSNINIAHPGSLMATISVMAVKKPVKVR